MALPDKAQVHAALRAEMNLRRDAAVQSARDAAEGATHEENRQEGAKDMRATESSYVARGQAMRAEALAEELARLGALAPPALGPGDPIAVGALVRLSVEDAADRVLYLAPVGGGIRLVVDGVSVTAVTPSAPVGRALLGKRSGDDFELSLRGAIREHVVEEVA